MATPESDEEKSIGAAAAMLDDKLDTHDFGDNSLDSVPDVELRNAETRSEVLAPYNTSDHDAADLIDEIAADPNVEIFSKFEQAIFVERGMPLIDFAPLVIPINREYEAMNNEGMDAGQLKKVDTTIKEKDRKRQKLDDAFHQKYDSILDHLPERPREELDKLFVDEPKNYYKGEIVSKLYNMGFTHQYINKSLAENLANHCTTTYYLLDKDQTEIL
jgi:hypothetical protein